MVFHGEFHGEFSFSSVLGFGFCFVRELRDSPPARIARIAEVAEAQLPRKTFQVETAKPTPAG